MAVDAGRKPAALVDLCRRIRDSKQFQYLSISIIILNGAALGALTFRPVASEYRPALESLDHAFLAFFVFELVVGIVSYAPRSWRFFTNAWNVFDFVIVVAAFVPGIRENVTVLRLLRLARIARLLRNIPSLRIILLAAKKAIPQSAGLFALMGVIMYLWAMVGWMAFGGENPGQFGSVGQSLLTLLQLVALDSIGAVIREAMSHSLWALPYTLVFVVLGSFLLLNILIGVVLASMEEAQAQTAAEDEADAKAAREEAESSSERSPEGSEAAVSADTRLLLARISELQSTVDRLAAKVDERESEVPVQTAGSS
ncbi:ion transporter [Salininema proteolyticum]|uniref:Ion transporter n=1 Tax=Salininema proteolyticum TaxID=1607685 RepID=A0ABV8U5M6_9ACTN